MRVEIIEPSLKHRTTVKNLFVLYRYDLSPFVESGPGATVNQYGIIDGETSRTHEESVEGCNIWWEKPGVLFPFLIRVEGRPSGFAMVASPPHTTRGVDYRMNEFFVMNKLRRRGVGREAAFDVFDRLRGKWEVGYLPRNTPAAAFWRRVIGEYTGGPFDETRVAMGTEAPTLPGYAFASRGR